MCEPALPRSSLSPSAPRQHAWRLTPRERERGLSTASGSLTSLTPLRPHRPPPCQRHFSPRLASARPSAGSGWARQPCGSRTQCPPCRLSLRYYSPVQANGEARGGCEPTLGGTAQLTRAGAGVRIPRCPRAAAGSRYRLHSRRQGRCMRRRRELERWR